MQMVYHYFACASMKNESSLNLLAVSDCDFDFKVLGCGRDVNLKNKEWLDES